MQPQQGLAACCSSVGKDIQGNCVSVWGVSRAWMDKSATHTLLVWTVPRGQLRPKWTLREQGKGMCRIGWAGEEAEKPMVQIQPYSEHYVLWENLQGLREEGGYGSCCEGRRGRCCVGIGTLRKEKHLGQSCWLTDNDPRTRHHREADKTAPDGKVGLKILERQLRKWKPSMGSTGV